MSDDRTKQGPQDRTRVNVSQEHEVQYWSGKFGVSEDELRRAVSEVGVMADDVGEYLKRNGRLH